MIKKYHNIQLLFAIMFSVVILTGCVNSLFYHPDNKVYSNPSQKNQAYEDLYFFSKDGTKLHGWFLPSKGKSEKDKPVGTVIHFHGNAQNLTAHVSFVDWLPEYNFNVFTFDYRGYGNSEGTPDRKGVYEDCIAAIDYIKTRKDVDQNRLFVLGQSLGGVNALAVMGENTFLKINAVAVDSAFYSYRCIVKDKLGAIPFIGLFKNPLSSIIVSNNHSPHISIDRIAPIPLLIIHGTADRVVPFEHGRALFEAAKSPKCLYVVEGGKHTDAFVKYGRTYKDLLVQFYIDSLSKNSQGKGSSDCL